ncbi:MAG: aldo/keto reductase [Oscillospiraceae bacterium]|nr:aldo/keto reductase [Oscillospiraceae bacterium]
MEMRTYREAGPSISLLGLGCMRLPKVCPDKDDIDFAAAQEMVDYAYAHGVNYYDTAYVYHGGTSEQFIGPALKKYPRDSYYLATKMPGWDLTCREDAVKIFEEQLANCQVDYFDFYLCHSLSESNYRKYKDLGVIDYLDEQKKAGRIRRLGFSFHATLPILEEVLSWYSWDFAQIQLNYLDWEAQQAKEQYEMLSGRGLPVIIMEPVRGGALASPCAESDRIFHAAAPGRSTASWAIRYAASLPGVLTVLSGMSSMEQLQDNIATMTGFSPLTPEEYEVVGRALAAYKAHVTIPCTGCRYCMDCPSGVDIPLMFKLYNRYAVTKDKGDYQKALAEVPQSAQMQSCVACGVCMGHCPQSIRIPDELARIRELADSWQKKA